MADRALRRPARVSERASFPFSKPKERLTSSPGSPPQPLNLDHHLNLMVKKWSFLSLKRGKEKRDEAAATADMEPRKSSYLFASVFASLLLSSMAGGPRKLLLNKDQVGSLETSESMQQQEDDEVVAHKRILRQVKTNDYGSYDPTPTMAKPHYKEIPH